MSQQFILKVSELTKKVKYILESEMNTVWLTGEISNFIAASSGHWYLTLKDSKAQVRCAMFKGNNSKVKIKPANGQQVLVRARVSLYEPRGDFQLIIDQMDDAGAGLLQQEYDKLKAKLSAKGYFSQQHKQALPSTINTIGVVTSPTGAAIKDILSVLQRRSPQTNIIIYPALVQGQEAKFDIVTAITEANKRQECDVLIVGRGGGSLEDLWPFNEELVVDAIYQSTIPIISAVGHEIDTTLADYVADLRAATPSAAAELASTNILDIIDKTKQLELRMLRQFTNSSEKHHSLLSNLQHRLRRMHPEQYIITQQQRADDLISRLTNAQQNKLNILAVPQQLLTQRIHKIPLHFDLAHKQEATKALHLRLMDAIKKQHENKQQAFVSTLEQLQLVSPLATIARGYSVTRNELSIVKSITQVNENDTINIQVADGNINAKVLNTSGQ